ncbi:MAG: VOC family protein [Bacteroidota bacterium]
MLQYAYTILYVPDVRASIEFYETAFDFSRIFISPENDYGELESGPTRLAFATHELAHSNFSGGFRASQASEPPLGIELAFTTTELSAAVERAVQAGARVLRPIEEKPWGQRVAYLRDRDGFLIELCTPMSQD